MTEPHLFEEMLTTYPAEKRELARMVYHRFADGDSEQFFTQLFLVLDVYAHYVERIPTRMISANADSLATLQEMREEISLLAKTIETLNVNITNHAEKTDELCRITLAKCSETVAGVELMVKNLGARVDTKTIVKGIENALNSGIRREVISPFIQRTEELAQQVMPTLESIREAANEAKSEWSLRIWKTAWTTSLIWSIGAAVICTCLICLKFGAYYEHKMAVQTADMAQVVKFNQEAFQKLVIAQVPVRVVPVQDDDGAPNPRGFALLIEGAYAAEMRPLDGQKTGCIFFNSNVRQNVAGKTPVERRIIKSDAQARVANGLNIFRHEIAMRRRPHARVSVRAVSKKREAVVMARGQHRVFHARRLGEFGPRRRRKIRRHKLVGELCVFVHGNLFVPLHPFAARGNRVDAPVDEHPELRIAPPREPGVALRGGFIARRRCRFLCAEI